MVMLPELIPSSIVQCSMAQIKPYSNRVTRLSRFVSALFNPLLLPVAVFAYSSWRLESDPWQILLVNGIGLTFFVLIPFVILVRMKRNKQISSIDVKERTSRNMPFVYGLMSMGAGLLAFQYLPVDRSLIYSILCMISINNTTIAAFINLRWKISIHSMAMSTTCVVLYFLSGPLVLVWPEFTIGSVVTILVLMLITFTVQVSRVILDFHTVAQVTAGAILAAILTIVQISLLIPDTTTYIKV